MVGAEFEGQPSGAAEVFEAAVSDHALAGMSAGIYLPLAKCELTHYIVGMGNLIDLTGKRFGRLVVSGRAANIHAEAAWLCICDCGNSVNVPGYPLRNGITQSCGCLRLERSIAASRVAHTTHGMTRTPTYSSWSQMRNRCTNPKVSEFKYYGGRGITVCDRWRTFAGFLADMGGRPVGHTLERQDTNGNYEPSNCRWATRKEQANNRRSCRIVTHAGLSLNIRQWSERTGLSHNLILKRLRRGWPPERALRP